MGRSSIRDEAERTGDGEQLDVEGEPLHEQERQHLLGDLAAEDLESDLRVAHVEAEENAHELLVEPAESRAARRRVVHQRLGMALRADGEVERRASSRARDEVGEAARIEVEIRVDVADPAPARLERAQLDRVALAEVPVVVDDGERCSLRISSRRSAVSSIDPSETTMSSNGSPSASRSGRGSSARFSTIEPAWLKTGTTTRERRHLLCRGCRHPILRPCSPALMRATRD